MTGAPSVFSIPAGTSFVDALARGLTDGSPDPLALSETLVLLPTRRGCRALRDAFLRLSEGRALLLPRMIPLGDIDDEDGTILDEGGEGLELPPAAPPLKRQLLLASLILKLGAGRGGEPPSPEQAAGLAAELARLLDQVHIEGLSFDSLDRLVPEEYAEHWKITLQFLKIVTEHWPAILAERGWMDPALRRNLLLERKALSWERMPPSFPVVAAGSTGSMPAVARLLATVARLPRGSLVLPGLDRHLDGESWRALPPSHPQYGLARLLGVVGVKRDEVRDWPRCQESPRAALVSEALRPDGIGPTWLGEEKPLDAVGIRRALDGLSRLDCPTPGAEAGAIALMMRETLEHEGRRAALVTPDRQLGRRVAAELRRFDIEIDDSAGVPLGHSEPGAFLLLVARMVASDFAPNDVLAVLKHRLARNGLPAGESEKNAHRLETLALRGPRPAPGIAGLRAVLSGALPEGEERRRLLAWLDGIAAAAAGFVALMGASPAPLDQLVTGHCRLAEALADDGDGSGRLWSGEAGEAAANFVADLLTAADALPPLKGGDYPGLLQSLMSAVTVRSAWGAHPRLAIWGPLEARLQNVDLLILGGLNEGCWPPETDADPWLSRPMREAFGLPAPERRVGLSAHDFEQAVLAPRVMLTRSVRVEGTPTVPSRWLLRLDALLSALGEPRPWPRSFWMDWHAALDWPERFVRPAPPAPCPPVAARPRHLSATAVETWMRDPYAIYARHVLGLKALEDIDADPSAADYGNVVHAALDAFVRAHSRGPLPKDAAEELLSLGRKAFENAKLRPGLHALWWPRFCSVARWFVGQDSARRLSVSETVTEVKGKIVIDGPAGPFSLSAVADRIDILREGGLAIIDYKTGAPPTAREVAAGFAPQLPIEAAIAGRGGFAGIAAAPVAELSFWRLKGGEEGGEAKSAGSDPVRLAAEALDGVKALVEAFDDAHTPYVARPHPDMAPRFSDYGHLARVREWAADETEDGA